MKCRKCGTTMKCPKCGYESPTSGSGKPIKSKGAEWLKALRATHGDGDRFFAAIRNAIGEKPFPFGSDWPAYEGFNLSAVPDEWYVEYFVHSATMTKGKHAGRTDLWYYTLAVKKLDPIEFAKGHSLSLG